MKTRGAKSLIETTAQGLRSMVLAMPEGELIGSEDALIARLGCSRSTVRQVARLLEREGLLKVRRGINGGYFSARPDAGTIEAVVSSYLEMLDVDARDVTIVASALWIEAMRKAAAAGPAQASPVVDRLAKRVKAIRDGASFATVRELELGMQAQVFDLARSAYVKLIFDINVAFSRRRYSAPIADDTSEEHLAFVRSWREAKLLELGAIREGDVELAGMAARHSRAIWHRRISARFPVLE